MREKVLFSFNRTSRNWNICGMPICVVADLLLIVPVGNWNEIKFEIKMKSILLLIVPVGIEIWSVIKSWKPIPLLIVPVGIEIFVGVPVELKADDF